MTHSTESRPQTGSTVAVLRSLQVTAALSVLVLLSQFITAGDLVTRGGGGEAVAGIHATGAIVLHVVTGLATIAAALVWRLRGAPLWPAVLAAVVFVLTFVQAYFGGYSTLYVHVPGAMILTVGSVWLLIWSFGRTARAGRL